MDEIYTLPTKRFSGVISKRTVLALVLLAGLYIANELFFGWARQQGVYENETYDLSSLVLNRSYASRKNLIPIRAIDFDSDDNLWVASKNSIIVLQPDGGSKTYEIKGSEITSLAVDSENQVWFGGEFGLRRLTQGGKWIPVVWDSDLEDKYVYEIAADEHGQLWIATRDYLSRLSDGEWTHFAIDYTSQYNTIPQGITIDQEGRVWIADGLYVGNLSPDGQWEEDIFMLGGIGSIAIDEQGNIWARIRNGLAVCNEKKCSEYTRYNFALPSGSLMAFDNNNRLWFPYSTGIRVLDVNQLMLPLILTASFVLRWVLGIPLLLITYFFVVRAFDERKGESIQGELKTKDILKKIWRNLVLVGVLGAILFLKFSASYIEFEFLVALLVLFEGALILIRILSLSARVHISKSKIVVCTIVGTLLTSGATALLFFLFIIIGVFTGFLAQ